LADYAKKLKKAPVIITKEGKPLAALISLINADMETISQSNNPKFIALIERSRTRQKKEGGDFLPGNAAAVGETKRFNAAITKEVFVESAIGNLSGYYLRIASMTRQMVLTSFLLASFKSSSILFFNCRMSSISCSKTNNS
jgi:hypothetical protein